MSRSFSFPLLFVAAAAALFLVLAQSCATLSTPTLPSGFGSPVSAGRALGPGDPWGGKIPKVPAQPLRVIHRSPVNSAEGASAIVVTFNQPMTALGPSADKQPAVSGCPIQVSPGVSGACRWVAGDTLKLALEAPLKNAHRYAVTVPTTLKALSGVSLEKNESWSFDTPRPKLLRARAYPDGVVRADRLRRGDALLLTFNLTTDPAHAARHARLLASGARVDCAAARYVDPRTKKPDPKRVVLTPRRPLPLGAKVVLEVPPGLGSPEGALVSIKARKRSFQVHGKLTVELTCKHESLASGGACWPMSNSHHDGLSVSLSEPVSARALARALRVTPRLTRPLVPGHNECDAKAPCAREWKLQETLRPRKAYRVTVAAGLKDIFGQRPGKPLAVSFRSEALPPGIFVPHDAEGIREPWQPYKIKTVNVRQLEVSATPLSGAGLVRLVECIRNKSHDWHRRCGAGDPAAAPRTVPIRAPADRVVERRLTLPRGLVRVSLSSPQVKWHDSKKRVRLHRLVTMTDLGLQARMTPFGLTAWVTGLRGGAAVAGAEVEVWDQNGKRLWTGRTDAGGVAQCPRGPIAAASATARLPADLSSTIKPPRLYVMARAGADRVYLTLTDHSWYVDSHARYAADSDDDDDEESERRRKAARLEPGNLSRYGAWQGDRPVLAGYISSERGIYRPGHRVHLHGAVRRFVTWRGKPAAGVSALVELRGPSDEAVAKKTVTLGAMGVFKLNLDLPSGSRLGTYRAKLRVAGKELARTWVRVAEYRAPRFAVHLKAGVETITGPGGVALDVAARYMHGGAMDGAAYRLGARGAVQRQELPVQSEHYVGAIHWIVGANPHTWERRAGTLDRQGLGRLKLQVPPPPRLPFPVGHTFEVEVRSPAGRTVAARRYVSQHPGDRYAAIKALPSEDKKHRRHVLVVDPRGKVHGGKVVARLHPVQRRKISWQYDVVWTEVIWRKELRVPRDGALLQIPWPARFKKDEALLVLSTVDAAGREAWTAERLGRLGDYEARVDRRQRLRQQRDAQLKISTDKKRYLPGEVATITVQRRTTRAAPLDGEVRLFVERERIFETRRLRFDRRGLATVKLKVTEAHARRVALRAVALRRGPALRGRLGPLVTAAAALVVSPKPYRLGIAIDTDRSAYRPGERVKVSLRVKDGLGRPRRAQVVLMAVDEAVLQLTAFRLPDPLDDLLHTPRLDVVADDVRHHLLDLRIPVVHRAWGRESAFGRGLGTVGHGGGGGGAGHGAGSGKMGKRKRSNFKTTAWHATLVTDEAGRARTSFSLPDNLTRYRIMAFAVDASRSAGTGRASITVDLPLLSLPVLPRLLRVGDRARAGVLIQNTAASPGVVTVTAAAEGAALSLSGARIKKVTLTRGSSATVRFDLKARAAGAGKLTFSVSGPGGVNDTLVHELEVKRVVMSEAASVSGETKGAVVQGIAPLSRLQPTHGGLEVSLSSTALSGVEDGMEQLIQYPYGCLEQKSSKLLAMLAAVALGKRFTFTLPGEPAELIRRGLQDILAMQRSDGGFGYWPGARDSSPFATAYALIVLHRAGMVAGATGVAAPKGSRDHALRYLQRYLKKRAAWWRHSDLAYTYRALVLHAMALHGKDVFALIRQLHQRRERQPLFVKALLLGALSTPANSKKRHEKDGAPMRKALGDELSDSLRVGGTWAHAEENLHDGYKVVMHSDDRSTAMVLSALLAARPDHPMVPRLVRWFLLGRKQARFRNTQEAAWALMALWDYARIREKEVPDFEAGVWLGHARVVKARFSGRALKPHQQKIPMERLMARAGQAASQLVIAKRGRGTLYYVARLRYAKKELPTSARDHGLKVTRTLQVLDRAGRPLKQPRPPRLDDTVLVTLKVSSSEARRYLVVDDPLPAGLEAIDTGLATAGRGFGAGQLWRGVSRFDHRELRDDRVLFFKDHKQPGTLTYKYLARVTTPGTFAAPPTKAEEMYTPEVYGHTAGGKVSYAAP